MLTGGSMKPLHQQSIYENLFHNMRIQCQECSGLCCVALYFSKMDGFPEHKEAGVPCSHLEEKFTCNIHSCLREKKLNGCLGYDCFGAGQLVTSKIYSSQTWIASNHKQQMFIVFQKVYFLQEILWYLIEASMLIKDRKIDDLIHLNLKVTSQTPDVILSFDIEGYRQKVNEVLKRVCTTIGCLQSKKPTMYLGKDLRSMNLMFYDFSMGMLIGTNVQGCNLYGTNFLGADVRDMNVMGADLRESVFLTQRQVNQMIGNQYTKLASYIQRPSHWSK